MAQSEVERGIDYELQDLNARAPETGAVDAFPQADRGIDAWLFLAGCFVFEGVLWGVPFSFGVFQEYYRHNDLFSKQASGIVVIGTCASGLMYLSGPLVFILLRRWRRLARLISLLGLCIVVLALLTASFAKEVWQLILTQGILYGVGGSLSYCPCILYMDEWFVKKQGLAFGIMWAGTGVSGVVMPFITQALITRWGFRTTLRAFAIAIVILAGPLTRYLKPRLPEARDPNSRKTDFSFLRMRTFWVYQAPNVIQGLGYFIPGLYLPSYANSLGLPPIAGPLTVALFNAALVAGTVVLGAQTDKRHVTTVIFISTTGAALSVFLVWGLSTTVPALCAFAVIYGFFAGAYSTCWSAMIKAIKRQDATVDTGLVFGMLAAGRGIGNIASGPVSESLLSLKVWSGEADFAYGSEYGALILFVGATALASGFSWIAKRVDLI